MINETPLPSNPENNHNPWEDALEDAFSPTEHLKQELLAAVDVFDADLPSIDSFFANLEVIERALNGDTSMQQQAAVAENAAILASFEMTNPSLVEALATAQENFLKQVKLHLQQKQSERNLDLGYQANMMAVLEQGLSEIETTNPALLASFTQELPPALWQNLQRAVGPKIQAALNEYDALDAPEKSEYETFFDFVWADNQTFAQAIVAAMQQVLLDFSNNSN